MKDVLIKISGVIKKIYGYGIAISLILGGLTVLAYIAALIIGGDTAALICDFIYNKFFHYLIIVSNIIVLLGLLAMYLSGEKSMTLDKEKRKKPEKK